jgi:hypothetical protein
MRPSGKGVVRVLSAAEPAQCPRPAGSLPAVSFRLDLKVEDLTEEQGRAVEAKSRARATWPIRRALRRRFAVFGPRNAGPALWMP